MIIIMTMMTIIMIMVTIIIIQALPMFAPTDTAQQEDICRNIAQVCEGKEGKRGTRGVKRGKGGKGKRGNIPHICHGSHEYIQGEKICHVEKFKISMHARCGEI